METSNFIIGTKTDIRINERQLALVTSHIVEFKKKSYEIAVSRTNQDKAGYIISIKSTLREFTKEYKKLGEHEQPRILSMLIKEANAIMIQILYTHATCNQQVEKFQKILNSLQDKEKQFVISLLSIAEEDAWQMSGLINQSSVQGRITKLGGLLTCAQIASRKINLLSNPYEFNPVILCLEEFADYLTILKNNAPCRERFVITGKHWIAGDILVNSQGKASLLFMESLGFSMILYGFTTEKAIKITQAVFPCRTIYVPEIPRQRDGQSCMMFALDDVRHLYTIEQYLPPQFKIGGLHAYLKANSISMESQEQSHEKTEIENNQIFISSCKLPLPFLRSMQFPELFECLIEDLPNEEKIPVNKKREVIDCNARARFFVTENAVEKNNRIHRALEKMIQFNLVFIHQHCSMDSIKKAMVPFTLEGLKQKYFEKNTLGKPIPQIPVIAAHHCTEYKSAETKNIETIKLSQLPLIGTKTEKRYKTLDFAFNWDTISTMIKELKRCPLDPWLYLDSDSGISFFRLVAVAAKVSYRDYCWDGLITALLIKFSLASEDIQKLIAMTITDGRYSSIYGIILETYPHLLPSLKPFFHTIFPIDSEARKNIIIKTGVWNKLIAEQQWNVLTHISLISKDIINSIDYIGNTLLMSCIIAADSKEVIYNDDDECQTRPLFTNREKIPFYRMSLWALSHDAVNLTIRNRDGHNILDIITSLNTPRADEVDYELFMQVATEVFKKMTLLPEISQKEMKKNTSPRDYLQFIQLTTQDASEEIVSLKMGP